MSVSDIFRHLAQPGGVTPTAPENRPGAKSPALNKGPSEFQSLLRETQASEANFNLSQHAETRIKSRAIPWDSGIEKRISSGIDAAEAKGAREALILADNIAVIANVNSRTIITAMDKSQMKEKIFTNIDSAVLV